jgi:hypothetical protein
MAPATSLSITTIRSTRGHGTGVASSSASRAGASSTVGTALRSTMSASNRSARATAVGMACWENGDPSNGTRTVVYSMSSMGSTV